MISSPRTRTRANRLAATTHDRVVLLGWCVVLRHVWLSRSAQPQPQLEPPPGMIDEWRAC
eukprot:COSAG01_NODE_3028_length_6703_cov_2.824955_4_plen_60_part_00